MPGKLQVLVALLILGLVLNLLQAALITAGIQAALIFGVLIGNDGVRTFLRGLAAVNILLILVMTAPSVGHGGPMVIVTIAVGVAVNAYVIWVLGQDDVREWMFRKNFSLDEEDPSDDDVPKL